MGRFINKGDINQMDSIITIPEKQRRIIRDLVRARNEMSERINLVVVTILSGYNIDDDEIYELSDDFRRLERRKAEST